MEQEQKPVEQETVKLPPHNLDAEEAVLGSCLIDPSALANIPNLHPDDFYREKNRWTFEAMRKLQSQDIPTDQITVAHELAKQHELEATGGAAYLSHLVAQVPTSVHVVYYAKIVADCSLRRRLISLANQIAAVSYDMGLQPEAFSQRLLSLQQRLNELLNTNITSTESKHKPRGNRKTIQPIEIKE